MSDFRLAMRGLCQSVGIVTTIDKGQSRGMTASSITSVSMDPPSVLVCVNKDASIHSAITSSRRFSVNFLSDDQEDLSRVFCSQMPAEERFLHGEWFTEDGCPPELSGALSVISCDLETTSTFATHTIFLGRVRTVRLNDAGYPLVYMQGRYHPLREKGAAA